MKIHELLFEAELPSKQFKILFHVGSLDSSKKGEGSYEGAGLSVSTHPDAWRMIARGHVVGDTYKLTKPGNRFIDSHKISTKNNQMIAGWAIENDLIISATTYRVSHYDDEMESEVYSDYASREEAEREAYDPEDISEIKGGYQPTQKLRNLTKNPRMTPTGIMDYVLPIYADSHGYDGVWWQDKLDVHNYSAPRGVIVPSQISSWKIEKS